MAKLGTPFFVGLSAFWSFVGVALAAQSWPELDTGIAEAKEMVEGLQRQLLETEGRLRLAEETWIACATGSAIGFWRHRVKSEKEAKRQLWEQRERVLGAGRALEDLFFELSTQRRTIEERVPAGERDSDVDYLRIEHLLRNYHLAGLRLRYIPSFEEYLSGLRQYQLSIENATAGCEARDLGSAAWNQAMSLLEEEETIAGIRRALDGVFSLIETARRLVRPDSTKF